MNFDDVIAAAEPLPGVEVSTWYGTPGLKVGGKGFCRMWGEREYRRDEVDDTEVLVVLCDFDEKHALIEAANGVLFETPHYEGHGSMLIRLADVTAEDLADWVADAWCVKASPKLLSAFHAPNSSTAE